MLRKISILIEKFWSNYFPSRQLLIKTGSDTKFFTLSSSTQAIIIFAVFIFVINLFDLGGSDNLVKKNFKVEIKWTNGTKKLFNVSELNQTITIKQK